MHGFIIRICHDARFYYKNISRCTVLLQEYVTMHGRVNVKFLTPSDNFVPHIKRLLMLQTNPKSLFRFPKLILY